MDEISRTEILRIIEMQLKAVIENEKSINSDFLKEYNEGIQDGIKMCINIVKGMI